MRVHWLLPALAACAAPASESTPDSGARRAFAVDDYTLPATHDDADALGSDLNGDHIPDDEFGNVIAAVATTLGDVRDDASIRRAIASGLDPTVIEIFDANGDAPGAIVGVRYRGSSALRARVQPDGTIATPGLEPTDMILVVPILIDADPIPLDVVFAQLQMAPDGSGYDVRMQGKLDADAVKQAACAGVLQMLAVDPQNSVTSDLDGNGDGVVTLDECLTSSTITELLAPDMLGPDDQPYLSFGIALHAQPDRNQAVFE